MSNPIIGVDPGASGGIAKIHNGEVVYVKKMPDTELDLFALFKSLNGDDPTVFIERVSAGPNDGKVSAFKFGMNYGSLRMAIIASGFRMLVVTPSKWCGAMGLKRNKNESQTAWKNRHKAMAQELFPGVNITHAIADALLIAEYGRREMK